MILGPILVKKIISSQTKHGLWSSNAKTGKFYHRGVRIEYVAPFSEPHLSCGPLVADLNHFHKHSNTSYGNLFGRGLGSEGGGCTRDRATAEKFNLPNTCLIWTCYGSFELHLSTDHEYISFFYPGPVFGPKFEPEFGPESNMAANNNIKLVHRSPMGAAMFFSVCMHKRSHVIKRANQIATFLLVWEYD